MGFNRKTFVIPDGTVFEERTLVTNADVIVADKSYLDYGIITDKRVFVGEKVVINGRISAVDDIRIDMWSAVMGDVIGENSVYLGDKVKVSGKVSVGRDFDVGDKVTIEKGFNAKGWINIRNPIPLVIYIFVYLIEMLRQGKSKEVEKVLNELEKSDEKDFLISDCFLFIPRNSYITSQDVKITGSCIVGKKCKITGNYFVSGSVYIGAETEFYGAVRSTGNIKIGRKTTVYGDVECKEELVVEDSAQILGDVKSNSIEMFHNAIITGLLKAENGVKFKTQESDMMKEKLMRFNMKVDDVDNVI